MSPRLSVAAPWLAWALVSTAAAQEPVAAFDRAYQAAQTAHSEGGEDLKELSAAALRAFLQIPRDDPGCVSRLPLAGWVAVQSDQHAMAQELLDEGWERVGPSLFLAEWRVRVPLILGDRAGAASRIVRTLGDTSLTFEPAALRRALASATTSGPGLLLAEADRLLRRGGTAPGCLLFELVAEGAERAPWSLGNLALAYRHVGRVDDCEAIYRSALEKHPRDEVLWNDYGLFLRGQGRLPEARHAFEQSLACDAQPGRGPGITNLVHLGWWAKPGEPGAGPPPLAAASTALALRPDAAMLRRLMLEALIRSD